jgi:hypothetical protein
VSRTRGVSAKRCRVTTVERHAPYVTVILPLSSSPSILSMSNTVSHVGHVPTLHILLMIAMSRQMVDL